MPSKTRSWAPDQVERAMLPERGVGRGRQHEQQTAAATEARGRPHLREAALARRRGSNGVRGVLCSMGLLRVGRARPRPSLTDGLRGYGVLENGRGGGGPVQASEALSADRRSEEPPVGTWGIVGESVLMKRPPLPSVERRPGAPSTRPLVSSSIVYANGLDCIPDGYGRGSCEEHPRREDLQMEESGIRTPNRGTRSTVFKTGAFNRSATSPRRLHIRPCVRPHATGGIGSRTR